MVLKALFLFDLPSYIIERIFILQVKQLKLV